jgi:hypothetical protein
MGFFSVALVDLMPKSVTKAILVFGVILTHCSFTVFRNIFWSGVARIELLGNPLYWTPTNIARRPWDLNDLG